MELDPTKRFLIYNADEHAAGMPTDPQPIAHAGSALLQTRAQIDRLRVESIELLMSSLMPDKAKGHEMIRNVVTLLGTARQLGEIVAAQECRITDIDKGIADLLGSN